MADPVKSIDEILPHLYKAFNRAVSNYEWSSHYEGSKVPGDIDNMANLAQAIASVEHQAMVARGLREYEAKGGKIEDFIAEGLGKEIKVLRPPKIK